MKASVPSPHQPNNSTHRSTAFQWLPIPDIFSYSIRVNATVLEQIVSSSCFLCKVCCNKITLLYFAAPSAALATTPPLSSARRRGHAASVLCEACPLPFSDSSLATILVIACHYLSHYTAAHCKICWLCCRMPHLCWQC